MPDNVENALAKRKEQNTQARAVAPTDPRAERGRLVKRELDNYTNIYKEAMPVGDDPKRLIRLILTQVPKIPRLLECSPISIVGAGLTCAQLGLEPGPMGEAWILPRYNKKNGQWEAVFQLGYKGMVALFWRHPLAAYLHTDVVYENDEFDYGYGVNAFLHHKPRKINGTRGKKLEKWYAVAKLTNGGFSFAVLEKEEVENNHRRYSASPKSPAWLEHYDDMAQKSCIVEIFKLMPKSAEIARGLINDNQVRTEIDTGSIDTTEYVENVNTETGEILDGEIVDERGSESGD